MRNEQGYNFISGLCMLRANMRPASVQRRAARLASRACRGSAAPRSAHFSAFGPRPEQSRYWYQSFAKYMAVRKMLTRNI